MVLVTLVGALFYVGEIERLAGSNRAVQRVTICVPPAPDKLGRYQESENYFDVFIYGEKDITKAWEYYRDNHPAPGSVEIQAQLVGRIKTTGDKPYNNITLRLLKIKFHYD